MRQVQMYVSESGTTFNNAIEALLEDLKDSMIKTGNKPDHGIAAADVVKVLKWITENDIETLDNFIVEMVDTKFGVNITLPPVIENHLETSVEIGDTLV